MAFHDKDHVISCVGTVIWEGVTNPDDVESKPGAKNWNLRIAVHPQAPEIAELNQLVQQALNDSEFKGVMPHGGNHPISLLDPAKFTEHGLAGYMGFGAGTRLGAPAVFDANGQQLDAMVYGAQLYNGAKVQLLVHAYAYSNKQKGVNFGLDGIKIVDGNPVTAPKLALGGGGMAAASVAAAFGGAPAPQMPVSPPPVAPAPAPVAPPAMHTSYMDPAAPPAPPAPAAPAPVAPPAPAVFPPAGWWPHPQVPGSFYNAAGTILTEAQLRAQG